MATTMINIGGNMVVKNVRNCRHLMVKNNPTQEKEILKPGGLDRMLCKNDGCFSLAMVRHTDNVTGIASYKTTCSKCNNALSAQRDSEHLDHVKGQDTWNCEDCNVNCPTKGKKGIAIEVHHVNGNHYDNRASNLRRLCFTCHNVYTQSEKHYLSYEIRFGCTKAEMRDRCKLNGLKKYNPKA